MARATSISQAEAAVMEVLWKRNPAGTEEIVASLASLRQWHESTIKTLLNRLLRKGAIRATREGRRNLYTPILKREDWLGGESAGLLDRLFGGRVAPFVAHFGRHRKLTRRDIEELKRLIGEFEDER
ncbi:MAG: BlaI/MecI/CopY family transcriptional regulator [Steroidobacteraceae bacterium]